MTISVETTPDDLNKGQKILMGSSPIISPPSSDRHLWSALRDRIDVILENRNPDERSFPPPTIDEQSECSMQMKEDSVLLMRGFDSMSTTLSHLSKNLDNALQGARDLSKPPTLTDIYQSAIEKAKIEKEVETQKGETDEGRGKKRKSEETCENGNGSTDDEAKLKKAKNLAISMGKKAASLAREIKSIRSDFNFMQERCTLLEEENKRLRDGFEKGIRAEEDDLMRLQMEALLAEKSRLASENANLKRENECLHQLAEYHQLTSEDLSDSYESLILQGGVCLDFSSPSLLIEDGHDQEQASKSPRMEICRFPDLTNE
ncbi:uncharacterized protein LOC124932547 [Impatiens glandulifera]|uniref:uncharacterized protein LOC124932547 n=1 Tax=Impatiens glandulifera TaxID=253017 RepID=UPI001FB17E6C|nr:uncharacterized protein LOC124932547 [Impatiens glandulifera]